MSDYMLSDFVRDVEHSCSKALQAIGFSKRGQRFVIDVSTEVEGSVGLNRRADRKGRRVELNPVMGVRQEALEERLDSIRGVPTKRGRSKPVTITDPIGYLMPQSKFTTWKFIEGDDPTPVAKDMAKAVQEYGIPFLEKHRTLSQVYDSLVARRYRGIEQEYAYSRPVAAWMLGMPGPAKAHLAEYLEKLKTESEFRPAQRIPLSRELGVAFMLAKPANDGALREYREFAEQLLKLIEEGSTPRP